MEVDLAGPWLGNGERLLVRGPCELRVREFVPRQTRSVGVAARDLESCAATIGATGSANIVITVGLRDTAGEPTEGWVRNVRTRFPWAALLLCVEPGDRGIGQLARFARAGIDELVFVGPGPQVLGHSVLRWYRHTVGAPDATAFRALLAAHRDVGGERTIARFLAAWKRERGEREREREKKKQKERAVSMSPPRDDADIVWSDRILRRAHSPLGVDDLAQLHGVHRRTVLRGARRECRMPANTVVSIARLYHAARLLLKTDHRVDAIARELAFPDAAALRRLVKTYTGGTPRSLRRGGRVPILRAEVLPEP